MEALGIDIGGTGIKAARVDTETGELLSDRHRVPTPKPASPPAVSAAVQEIVKHFGWKGPVGCGFPGAIRRGVVLTAANVSKKWLGVQAEALFENSTGCAFTLANDADVAGLAEMRFGAGKDRMGTVLMLTFGTGIGTALFLDGQLLRNVELGDLELLGREAERWASERNRVEEGLSWKAWAKRVNIYLNRMEDHFWPELIIIGGGASKKYEKFASYLSVSCDLAPAKLRNRAGIIGAALLTVESRPS